MDAQTTAIVKALRSKCHSTVLQQEWSPLHEFYDPSREKAKLRKTALAGGGAAAKPAAKPAEPAKPAGREMSASEKAALAKVTAKPAAPDTSAADAKKAALSARLKAIKGKLNQSLDTLDVPVLVEEMEALLLESELTVAERLELRQALKGVCEESLAIYEMDEELTKWFTGIVLGEAKKNTLPNQGSSAAGPSGEGDLPVASAPAKVGLQKKTNASQTVVSPGAGAPGKPLVPSKAFMKTMNTLLTPMGLGPLRKK